VEEGLVRTERAVVVPAGSQGRIDIPLTGARVQLSVTGPEPTGPSAATVFSIVEDDPDAPRGRREVLRSAARQAEFVLPPGTYYVVARQGSAEAREQLALSSGDVIKRTLVMGVGRLNLSTRLNGAEPPSGEPISYRIERLDGAQPEVLATSKPSAALQLAGGRYRVEGRLGTINSRVVRDIEIKVGQVQPLTLDHQAATVQLRLATSAASSPGDVFWDIREESGDIVWTTGQPEPSATIRAGQYRVRAETRDKTAEQLVELRPGEARLIEVRLD
jgi:Ca-activated chloride channel family protein